eukprot:SAG31_NODE_733_length_12491_cov_7.073112_1_plen_185_part_00
MTECLTMSRTASRKVCRMFCIASVDFGTTMIICCRAEIMSSVCFPSSPGTTAPASTPPRIQVKYMPFFSGCDGAATRPIQSIQECNEAARIVGVDAKVSGWDTFEPGNSHTAGCANCGDDNHCHASQPSLGFSGFCVCVCVCVCVRVCVCVCVFAVASDAIRIIAATLCISIRTASLEHVPRRA